MAIEKESLRNQEIAGLTLSLSHELAELVVANAGTRNSPLHPENPSTTKQSDDCELEHPHIPPIGPENGQRAGPSSHLTE